VGLEVLSLLSKKWQPVVLIVLSEDGPCGFTDLQSRIHGISGKVLSETLSSLQEVGMIERTEVSDSPLRVEYTLTEAGRDIEPIFESLSGWGQRYLEGADPRIVVAETDHRLTALYREWIADRYTVSQVHDGDALEATVQEPTAVVLLDVQLPGVEVSTFVSRFVSECRIVLLVGDRPDFELLRTPCDDMLRKPIVRETALETIETQVSKRDAPSETRKRAALQSRLACFESIYSAERLTASPIYRDCRGSLGEATTEDHRR
jgi:DNA-binding HxlR family transcriptional regulator